MCDDIDGVVSLYKDEEDDPSPDPISRSKLSKDQLRNVRLWEKRQDRRRKKRLWEQRSELPVCLVNGRKAGTIALRSCGDSDNGDDTYFGDREIQKSVAFFRVKALSGFTIVRCHQMTPTSQGESVTGSMITERLWLEHRGIGRCRKSLQENFARPP